MTKFTEPTFNNDRLHGLLSYLDRLERLNNGQYNCSKEIAECIGAIREELSLLQKSEALTAEEVSAKIAEFRGKYQ